MVLILLKPTEKSAASFAASLLTPGSSSNSSCKDAPLHLLAAPVKLYRCVKISQDGCSYGFPLCCNELRCSVPETAETLMYLDVTWVNRFRLPCHCKGNRLPVQRTSQNEVLHFKSAWVTGTLGEETLGDSPGSGSSTGKPQPQCGRAVLHRRVHTILLCHN